MDFIAAIKQVADDLVSGATVEEALKEASQEFEIPVPALRNRFEKAHGDINAFATKRVAANAAIAASAAETAKRRDREEKDRQRDQRARDLLAAQRANAYFADGGGFDRMVGRLVKEYNLTDLFPEYSKRK